MSETTGISIGICTWNFKLGCLTWFRFRVSIHHLLGLNWHPVEGPGLQDHDLFLFYGLLLCFCVVVHYHFFEVFVCCFVFSGQFRGCKWTGIMKQANAVIMETE